LFFGLDSLDQGGPLAAAVDGATDDVTTSDSQGGDDLSTGDDGGPNPDVSTSGDDAPGDAANGGGDAADATSAADGAGDDSGGAVDAATDSRALDTGGDARDALAADGPQDASGGGSRDATADSAPGFDAAYCNSAVLSPVAGGVAASSWRFTNYPIQAVDNNFLTRWESTQQADEPDGATLPPQWIYVDFGARVVINRVRILWEDSCANTYQFEVSDNATNWAPIPGAMVTGNTIGSPVSPTNWMYAADTQGLSGVGRYLRVYMTVRCRIIYGYSMWEMQAFGHPVAGCDGGP
jgi:hypothetical protein